MHRIRDALSTAVEYNQEWATYGVPKSHDVMAKATHQLPGKYILAWAAIVIL